MDKLVERFLQNLTNTKTGSKHTLDAYSRDLKRFVAYMNARDIYKIEDIDKELMLFYTQDLKSGKVTGKSLSESSYARHLSTIKSFYRYLNAYEGIDSNPIRSFKGNTKKRRLPDFLTFDEMSTLLNNIDVEDPKGLCQRCIIELMSACGLRLSEITQLEVKDLSFDEQMVFVHGKGDKERIVPFYPKCAQLLKRYLLEVRPLWDKGLTSIFFITSKGKPLRGRAIEKMVAKVALDAGLNKHVHPHMIRHSFATYLLDNGADLRMVQELLGHENLSTTQIYTHMTIDHLNSAVNHSHPYAKKKA